MGAGLSRAEGPPSEKPQLVQKRPPCGKALAEDPGPWPQLCDRRTANLLPFRADPPALPGSPAVSWGRVNRSAGFAAVKVQIDTCDDRGVRSPEAWRAPPTATGRVAPPVWAKQPPSQVRPGGREQPPTQVQRPGDLGRSACHATQERPGQLASLSHAPGSAQVTGCGDIRLGKLLWLSSLHNFLLQEKSLHAQGVLSGQRVVPPLSTPPVPTPCSLWPRPSGSTHPPARQGSRCSALGTGDRAGPRCPLATSSWMSSSSRGEGAVGRLAMRAPPCGSGAGGLPETRSPAPRAAGPSGVASLSFLPASPRLGRVAAAEAQARLGSSSRQLRLLGCGAALGLEISAQDHLQVLPPLARHSLERAPSHQGQESQETAIATPWVLGCRVLGPSRSAGPPEQQEGRPPQQGTGGEAGWGPGPGSAQVPAHGWGLPGTSPGRAQGTQMGLGTTESLSEGRWCRMQSPPQVDPSSGN